MAAALALGAATAAGGCGSGGGSSATNAATSAPATTPPAASAPATPPPAATAPPPTQTAPPAATAPPSTQTTAPEDQPGGAGDEQPIRIPARFTFSDSGVSPSEVAVPAFFTIRLVGVSKDGRPHTLQLEGTTVRVPAGGRAAGTVEGLKKGRYGVTIDGRENAATIVSGAKPGP